LPIEVVPFGLKATEIAIAKVVKGLGMSGDLRLRAAKDGKPFVTDSGNLILDVHLGRIEKPDALAVALNAVPGVVEHGLFLGLATGAILATGEGLVELGQV
jgi:ribose 5-phosphate isomerase A